MPTPVRFELPAMPRPRSFPCPSTTTASVLLPPPSTPTAKGLKDDSSFIITQPPAHLAAHRHAPPALPWPAQAKYWHALSEWPSSHHFPPTLKGSLLPPYPAPSPAAQSTGRAAAAC